MFMGGAVKFDVIQEEFSHENIFHWKLMIHFDSIVNPKLKSSCAPLIMC